MFIKECNAISKSIIYFAFLAVVVLFYMTQFGNNAGKDIEQYTTYEAEPGKSFFNNPFIAPVPGQDNYGYIYAEIPEQVMPNAIVNLAIEHRKNEFACYSTGFYKGVKLSQSKLDEISFILTELTGLSEFELYSRYVHKSQTDNGTSVISGRLVNYSEVIPVLLDYNEFKEKMIFIDNMIGGGSSYAVETLKRYGQKPVTYEEKLEEYNNFLSIDKITGAYARLFCDYMGIVIAIFSVFVPVSFLLRDKRAKMNELIYSRGKSSASIILSRYSALVCMTILPFILLSLIPTIQLSLFAVRCGLAVDYLAFIKYIAAWLMPTVLTVTASAYLFTVLTDTPIAVLLQLIFSLWGLFTSVYTLEGGHYGIEIAIRHNSLGNLKLYQENINGLIINRLSYTLISLVLVSATIYLYNLKRRGQLDVFKCFKKFIRNH